MLILLSSSFLIIINIIFWVSLRGKTSSHGSNVRNKISVIIAAKDEADNIGRVIASIRELNYCKDNFEVILVDDESTDSTFQTAVKLAEGLANFHIYKAENKTLPAKKGALTFGINKAANPFILITDADCLLPKDWLKIYSSKFDKGYDFIFGPAPFTIENSFTNKAVRFENLRSSILLFAAAKLKIPYSAAARNFGFRKSAFKTVQGYSNTNETLSGDDDLLLREAVKHKMKIGIVTDKDAAVFSSAKKTLKEYLIQRTRHTKTSLYYLRRHQFILGFWHLLNLTMLFSPLLMPINRVFIIPFIIKMAFDLLTISIEQKKFSYRFSLLEIIPLQVFYELLLIVNFAGAFFKKESWQ